MRATFCALKVIRFDENVCFFVFLSIFLSRDDDNPRMVNQFRSTAWTDVYDTTLNIEHVDETLQHKH